MTYRRRRTETNWSQYDLQFIYEKKTKNHTRQKIFLVLILTGVRPITDQIKQISFDATRRFD